jgi:hypothetical protein
MMLHTKYVERNVFKNCFISFFRGHLVSILHELLVFVYKSEFSLLTVNSWQVCSFWWNSFK